MKEERSQAHVISVEDSPLLGAMIGNSLKSLVIC